MALTAHAPLLAYLDAQRPLPPVAALTLRLAVVFAQWSQRRRTRQALKQLDDHLLRDLGLERHVAQAEARRMFWQG
ncbi:DUF1127 domain-containing protein [Salipiger marinus]|mgnify:CR=1 FL=1|jgi:uncharacterized protein YjiS (DUF1127 family)|uniref:Uncharacterized conserved protein YjiS, DUF1127 family n=1 Tax=Salipiger marinus TaxID=555512 RepID=A0A1G8TNB6_9RHOB|nr:MULTISPECIES: DUF1127 domain-containing protein [Salipiger]HBM58287.1 DUF1127 domain-containing protein [Citreicella sp.]MCD1619509.1 DUF1127 domain-containing protein [Salipiger manganoxidans]MEB3420343.1 DUF1127 domain-containing protein [Salipiger manganoxidans]SDJ43032.1 Uncharacterized conserved protein YjiS, DUF1127 family [Salipiger marinus]HBS99877.1 DUF1127 domain-containing protein [Citreicella sp.]